MMFDDWDELSAAFQAYADRFGENPPLIEMPLGPEEHLALIRAALASGEPYQADIPEGAII